MADDKEQVAIEFPAEVRGVKTMADLTASLTLNVPEPYKAAVMEKFSRWQGLMVHIIAVQED